MKRMAIGGSAVFFLTSSLFGQQVTPKHDSVPIYNVTVVERTTKAINYSYRTGPTMVDFRGTVLMPEAKGQAVVESKRGRTEIDLKIDNLAPPSRFGREYLTYTLWAITPEGAPHNIGEIIPNGGDKVRMHVTTELQAFGLIVTAEPFSTARQPSDVVVLENQVRPDTMGMVKDIQVKYELMPRGHYTYDVANKYRPDLAGMPKLSMDQYEAVLEVYEAQNAINIARAAGAEQYAPQTFDRAQQMLADAQKMQGNKGASAQMVQIAREAAQTAEDARMIADKRRQEDRLAHADQEIARAQRAQAEAQNEANRLRQEADSARAEAVAERTARERAEADAAEARRRAAQEQAALIAPPPPPQQQESPADSRRTEARMQLLDRMNGVLLTRDTPRGLVAILSDGAFEGTELRPAIASQLGRLVAALTPYSALRVAVEGHSDSASTDGQALRRAEAVRRVLTMRGLSPDRTSVQSLGDSRPVVANNTPGGREQNRRVEIVISGDAIGTAPIWDRTYSLIGQRH